MCCATAVALAGWACNSSDNEDDPTPFSSGIGDGGDTVGGDDDDDDDDDKLDVEPGDGTAAGDEAGDDDGCAKVDFLFVIDSSPSMEDEQANLLTSFPGFITAIEDTLDIDDFHLMVVDAGLPMIPPPGCDGTLGAGQTKNAAGTDCGLDGEVRYATEDQSDLGTVFQCIGNRGFNGPGDEQTMDALLASIGPLLGEGQCNEGFLRDDAILVITIISDEEDSPGDTVPAPALDGSCEPADADPNSSGDPASWRTAIIDAKNGDPKAAVVLGLLGDCDEGGSCPGIALDPLNPAAPITGAEPAPRLRELAMSFPFGSVGPVCAPDYAPFFEEAVSVIESACDDFVPPA